MAETFYCEVRVEAVHRRPKVKSVSLTLMPEEATVKCFDLVSTNRPSPHWAKLALAGVMVAALAGCGGGSDGAPGATGATGATGPAGPASANAVATVNAASLTQAQWIALNPVGTVTGVNVSAAKGQPVVNFKLT